MSDLNTMYGVDENAEDENETPSSFTRKNSVIVSSTDKTKVILVDSIKVEVVNPEYVFQLEQTLTQALKDVKNATQKVTTLNRMVTNLTRDVQRLTREVNSKQDKYRG